jgi:hypothetical protein
MEYLPIAQSTHTSGPVAPLTVEYRPVPQPVQSKGDASCPVPYVPA